MTYRRIGVIVAELQCDYQSKLIHGITKLARSLGYDSLIYNSFVKGYANSDFEVGEQYLLSMPQYEQLDGVIVLGDTIKWPGAMDKLIARLEASGKPVVFIDYAAGHHFENVSVDDVYPFERLVDHLIVEHNCHDILFYSGPETVSSTAPRLAGYRRSLKKHNLSDHEYTDFSGNYAVEDGRRVAQDIIANRIHRPDAIVFSGDPMAIGAVEEFVANGWDIPQDIVITGYDGSDAAIRCTPSVTSYSPPIEAAGENAMYTLDSMIRNIPMENKSIDPGRLEIGNTCGCKEDRAYTKRIYYRNNADLEITKFLDSNMMEDLSGTKDFTSLLECIQYYLYLVQDWNDFYLCLNEDWDTRTFSENEACEKPYSDQMILFIKSQNCKNRTVREQFALTEQLPILNEPHKEPKTYYFNPIHQGLRSYGYSVVSFGHGSTSLDISYMNWCRHLSNAIEFQKLRAEITKLAVTDTMTGLLTRMGMDQQMRFVNLVQNDPDTQCLVLVVDADHLKETNDTYGHHAGDDLIRTIADCLKTVVGPNELCCRIGGDEFLIYGCGIYNEKTVTEKAARLQELLDEINAQKKFPFLLSASIGGIVRRIENMREFDEACRDADLEMYRMKKEHHAGRT